MSLAPLLAPPGVLLQPVSAAPAQDSVGQGLGNGVITDESTSKPIAGAVETLRAALDPNGHTAAECPEFLALL